jgi:hypothetical protein
MIRRNKPFCPYDLFLMPSPKVQLHSVFREIAPQPDAPELLVEQEGRLKRLRADGKAIHDYGSVGPVECPLAYDPASGTAYRYVCASSGSSRRDFSQLRAFSVSTGQSSVAWKLPVNRWVLWFLEWIVSPRGRGGQLFGLMAIDRPVDGQVAIEHRLFALDPNDPAPKYRPLCRDAYKPLAFSRQQRKIAFSGAEGTYIVSLKGGRLASLGPDILPTAHGGSFDPSGKPRIALGGRGVHLWDFERGSCTELTPQGRHPLWSSDGRYIWYAGSSGALMRYDLESGEDEQVLAMQPDRFPDFWKSRPAALSRCGRYLATMLSTKRLRGITQRAGGIESKERVFTQDNCFCLVDVKRSEFWRIEGTYFSAFRWL